MKLHILEIVFITVYCRGEVNRSYPVHYQQETVHCHLISFALRAAIGGNMSAPTPSPRVTPWAPPPTSLQSHLLLLGAELAAEQLALCDLAEHLLAARHWSQRLDSSQGDAAGLDPGRGELARHGAHLRAVFRLVVTEVGPVHLRRRGR